MKKKIAFYDTKPYDIEVFDTLNKNLGFNYSISYFREHLTADTAILSRGHNAVCAFVNDSVDSKVIEKLSQYKIGLIALRSAGYNNVDLKAAYGNIHIVRVPEYSPHAVAEHAAALILSLNRKTHRASYRTKDRNFNINGLMGFDLYKKTAGIIGTGKIGKIMIEILKGFGMELIAFDPHPDSVFAGETGVKYASLDELFKKSDIISLHCPLNRQTFQIINAESISKMKPDVMIINTGRGKLIDTKALIDALKEKRIGSAGLDVYEEESEYFFEDFSNQIISDDMLLRLLTFPNVLITSHQGFFTREAMQNIADTTLRNIGDYLAGKKLVNEVCYRCEDTPCRREKEGKCF